LPRIGRSRLNLIARREKSIMSDPLTNRFRPHVEGLEEREVPSATVSLRGGVLRIRGSRGADKVTVAYQGGRVVVRQGGTQAKSSGFATSAVNRLVFQGLAGNDSFVNNTNVPATVSTGSGNNFVQTLTGQDTITTGTGLNQILAALGDQVPAANGRNVVVLQQIVIFPGGNNLGGFSTQNGLTGQNTLSPIGTTADSLTGVNSNLGTGFNNGLGTGITGTVPTTAGIVNVFGGSQSGTSGFGSTGANLVPASGSFPTLNSGSLMGVPGSGNFL